MRTPCSLMLRRLEWHSGATRDAFPGIVMGDSPGRQMFSTCAASSVTARRPMARSSVLSDSNRGTLCCDCSPAGERPFLGARRPVFELGHQQPRTPLAARAAEGQVDTVG